MAALKRLPALISVDEADTATAWTAAMQASATACAAPPESKRATGVVIQIGDDAGCLNSDIFLIALSAPKLGEQRFDPRRSI
jgi:hypothetical protein